jgi:hypothetical protein
MKVPLDKERHQILQDLVSQDGIQLDDYLPADTMQICASLLAEVGGLPAWQTVQQIETPYFPQYDHLRKRLREYIDKQESPKVSLLSSPTGGIRAFKELLQKANINTQEFDIESESEPDDDILPHSNNQNIE